MVNSVPGGGPHAPAPFSSPPVIAVPSASVFGFMRTFVNVIHSTQFTSPHQHNYGPSIHLLNHVRRTTSSHESTIEEDNTADDPNVRINSTAPDSEKTPPVSGDPRTEKKEQKPESSAQKNPLDQKVPNLTDRGRSSTEEKDRFRKMITDMLEKISRIVKDIQLSKEVIKREVQDSALKNKENKAVHFQSKCVEERADLIKQPSSLEEALQSQEVKEEDSHRIEFILENVAEDGLIEQISVEKGDIALLIGNLEEMLAQKNILEESFVAPLTTIPTKEKLLDSASEEKVAEADVSNLSSGPKEGHVSTVPAVTLAQESSVAAAMNPLTAASRGIDLFGGKNDKVGSVDGLGLYPKEGVEATKAKSLPSEALIAAKLDKKSPGSKDVQEVAGATAKDQLAKKQTLQRVEEGKITSVLGKLAMDQSRGSRRRKSKGESDNTASKADVHRLIDLFYMVLCAVVCGSQTVFEIAAFIESREKFFTTALGLRNGLPNSRLINKLLVSFNPNELPQLLNTWIKEAQGLSPATGLTSIIVTETFEGLIFGQEIGGISSTDQVCMPRLLQFLDMKGLVVLLSNGKTSKKLIPALLSRGVDYIYDCGEESFPNEPEIIPLFEKAIADPKKTGDVQRVESYVEGLEYLQLYELAIDLEGDHIRSVAQVLSEVHSAAGKEEVSQYFTSSLPKPSVWLFELLRIQRPLEGKTDWMMNLSMRRKHSGETALATREFLAMIRRYAIELLLRDQTLKAPLHIKQQNAAKDVNYLMRVLGKNGPR